MKKIRKITAVTLLLAFILGTIFVPEFNKMSDSNVSTVEAESRLKTNIGQYHICKYQRVRGKAYTGKKKYEKSGIHREIKNFRMCKYYYKYTYKQYFYTWQCSTCKKRKYDYYWELYKKEKQYVY